MRTTNLLSALIAGFLSFTVKASAAPILLVSSGALIGANGVVVDGISYDVMFVDGSCDSVFNGCSQSAFAFSTEAMAVDAAQALLDQVLLDGPFGQFDSNPNRVFGCDSTDRCGTWIPFFSVPTVYWQAGLSVNYGGSEADFAATGSAGTSTDLGPYDIYNIAVFRVSDSVSTDVPEPSSIALTGLGLALAGLAFKRSKT